MAATVRIERTQDLATVTIDRPERRNALDASTAAALKDALVATGDSRVVVLTGAGGAFCAGGDLDELVSWSDAAEEDIASRLYEGYQGSIRAIRGSDAVVIAAIDGAAMGAGLDLALACDLRVATERSRFGQVWARLGLIPGTGGAWLTQHLAGPTKAAELLLTAKVISAAEAFGAGLLNEVVPEDAVSAARRWGGAIMEHPRDGVVANKRAYVAATAPYLEAALGHAAEVQPDRFLSQEFKDAARAARNRER